MTRPGHQVLFGFAVFFLGTSIANASCNGQTTGSQTVASCSDTPYFATQAYASSAFLSDNDASHTVASSDNNLGYSSTSGGANHATQQFDTQNDVVGSNAYSATAQVYGNPFAGTTHFGR